MKSEKEKENNKYNKIQKKQNKMLFVAFYILLNLVSLQNMATATIFKYDKIDNFDIRYYVNYDIYICYDRIDTLQLVYNYLDYDY